MSLPLRSLPVVQNWDCHRCATCCHDYEVVVTEEERQRIIAQQWENDAALKGVEIFRRKGWFRPRYSLQHRESDAGCVFLDEQGLCRIHGKFGYEAKPLACKVYPFILVPTGEQWRVGMRFACPSVTANKGQPLAVKMEEVRGYADDFGKRIGIEGRTIPNPILQGKEASTWSDVYLFVHRLMAIISDASKPIEFRLRKSLALIATCREAKFDSVRGHKLKEFLELVSEGIGDEIPAKPEDIPLPGWIGRILFRQLIAIFARKDSGQHRGISRKGRLALLWAAWRFARGTKRIPRLHGLMAEMTFEEIDQPAGPMPASADQLLTRYFQVKLESLQFCGPTNFHRKFFDGLESLMLTFPAVLWLTRNFSRTMPYDEAITLALRLVDDNFGFNPLLGSSRQLFALRTLARRGEIAKLVAWYSR